VVVVSTDAAEEAAICCHNAETRAKSQATVSDQAMTETEREGKGLMSMSEQIPASLSSRQLA